MMERECIAVQMVPKSYCNLNFSKTVTSWDEAIPLGNGLTGALIWGPGEALRFSLDRGDIWDTTPFEGINSPEFTYENMVALKEKGDIESIRRIFDAPYNHPLPSKLPAGVIVFDLKAKDEVYSALDLSTASAAIRVGGVMLESFLHAEEKYGFIKLNKKLSEIDFHLENPDYGLKGRDESDSPVNSVNTASIKRVCYEPAKAFKGENRAWFTQKVSADFSYGVFLAAKEAEGRTEIVFLVASSKDGANWCEEAMEIVDKALEEGYENAFIRHWKWWVGYWGKSGISLPNKDFEKQWYLTNYLLASCSRKGSPPMPLQGVWTADNGSLPPWKGDYHHDLNTQMSYYSYLKANHIEEGESFVDFLWELKPAAEEFAKSFYGAKGLCLPAVMTIDGKPLGGWGMYSLSPTNQLWLCQAFERHYRFTGDREFLKEKAYPYLMGVGQFILSLLEERDGLLYLPISSSPEIHDDNIEAFLTPNSHYDLSLMRYLFTSLVEMARELGDGNMGYWQATLDKLPELAVDRRWVYMLSPDEILQESHRHLAHLMAIHPLRLTDYLDEKNQRIIDNSIADLERLGTGAWCGYSFGWAAEIYAIQRSGNGAAYQLKVFWENTCSQNGFHLNGDYKRRGTSQLHYRPFTLEGNFCAADALQEMLLQSERNRLVLFPAIPDEWLEGEVSFRGFRGEKGLIVSANMAEGLVTGLALCCPTDISISIEPFEGPVFKTLNEHWPLGEDGLIHIELEAGCSLNFGDITIIPGN